MERLRLAGLLVRLSCELLWRDCGKYLLVVAALSLPRMRVERWRMPLLRALYFYFRLLDDLVDGDRPSAMSLDEFLDRQEAQWQCGLVDCMVVDDASRLLRFILTQIAEHSLPAERITFFALSIIEGLRFDLCRVRSRRRPSEKEIDHYYRQVILAPAVLAHLILDARASLSGLAKLSDLIGRLQSLRDLEGDVAAGKINLTEDGFLDGPMTDFPVYRAKATAELAGRLRDLWYNWARIGDARSLSILRPVVRSLLAWAGRMQRARVVGVSLPRPVVRDEVFISTV